VKREAPYFLFPFESSKEGIVVYCQQRNLKTTPPNPHWF